jgi:hypothetical protein
MSGKWETVPPIAAAVLSLHAAPVRCVLRLGSAAGTPVRGHSPAATRGGSALAANAGGHR